jgi:hypothetical protein
VTRRLHQFTLRRGDRVVERFTAPLDPDHRDLEKDLTRLLTAAIIRDRGRRSDLHEYVLDVHREGRDKPVIKAFTTRLWGEDLR